MKHFSRIYHLDQLISPERVLIIYGPRRVGKTTLLNAFLKNTPLKYKLDNGDNINVRVLLSSQDIKLLREYVQDYQLIAIDEAQRIEDIGWGLKLMSDHFTNLHIIATGSSSFRLSHGVGEPLTGRKRTVILYPLSMLELRNHLNPYELKEQLPDFLRFGSYPEVLSATTVKEKIFILKELAGSYLLKDILELEQIRASRRLLDLLKLLAFQIGHEVSLNELGTQVGMDVKTVARYLDLLEKGFVIKRVGGFSRNLRKEITTKAKYYFLDTGIRNAVINQFNPLSDRNDQGILFENFIVMERLKFNTYKERYAEMYFWRTHTGEEIDLIEDSDGKLQGFEIKWSEKKTPKAPKTWGKTYPNASFSVINQQNYLDYLV